MTMPSPLYAAICVLVHEHGLSNTLNALAEYADACAHVDIKDGGDGKSYEAICNALKQLAQDALNA